MSVLIVVAWVVKALESKGGEAKEIEGSGLEEWNTGNVEPNQVTVINFHQAVHQQHPGRGANGRYKIASTGMKEREKEAGFEGRKHESSRRPFINRFYTRFPVSIPMILQFHAIISLLFQSLVKHRNL